MNGFDFFNSSFSGLLAILMCIWSTGYPLVKHQINRINEKYNSAAISSRLAREPIYKWYKVAIILNLIYVIISMLILAMSVSYQVLIIITQTVSLISLAVVSYCLLQRLSLYEDGERLLALITSKGIDRNNVKAVFDLVIYADISGNQNLYASAMYKIYEFIRQTCKIESGKVQLDGSPSVNLDPILVDILESWRLIIKSADSHPTLTRDTNIIRELLVASTDHVIGVGLVVKWMIWELTTEAVICNKRHFFKNFWRDWCSSYDSNRLSLSDIAKSRFKQRNIALGGLLFYHNRLEWVKDLMLDHDRASYSSSIFPSTFEEIISQLNRLDPDVNVDLHRQNLKFTDREDYTFDTNMIFEAIIAFGSVLIVKFISESSTNCYLHPDLTWSDGRVVTSRKIFNVISEKTDYLYKYQIYDLIGLKHTPEKRVVMEYLEDHLDIKSETTEEVTSEALEALLNF